jgi:hypothetical protein
MTEKARKAFECLKLLKHESVFVMAGLVPAIHVFLACGAKDVDARHPSPPRLRRATSSLGRRSFSEGGKAGHDDELLQKALILLAAL